MAEGDLKTMSAVEHVKERRTARQHGPGHGEAGQSAACTAWREKVLRGHGDGEEQREEKRRVSVGYCSSSQNFYFSQKHQIGSANE